MVASAGNYGTDCPFQCNVCLPAINYDVIGTAALADTIGYTAHTVDVANYSSSGAPNKVLQGSAVIAAVPAVGLVTFGTVRKAFNANANGYSPLWDVGTSFASPQVASLAVLFREWLRDTIHPLRLHAWATGVNVLLMGDGRCGLGAACSQSVHAKYGFGFPRYFVPTLEKMGSGGGWGTRRETIVHNQTIAWDVGGPGAEASTVNGWKFALAVDTDSAHTDSGGFTNLPELNVRVVDKCNGNIVIRQAAKQGTRYLMNIRHTADIRGRCLEVRVTGTNVRAAGETFYAADYFFTNATTQHLYVP